MCRVEVTGKFFNIKHVVQPSYSVGLCWMISSLWYFLVIKYRSTLSECRRRREVLVIYILDAGPFSNNNHSLFIIFFRFSRQLKFYGSCCFSRASRETAKRVWWTLRRWKRYVVSCRNRPTNQATAGTIDQLFSSFFVSSCRVTEWSSSLHIYPLRSSFSIQQ